MICKAITKNTETRCKKSGVIKGLCIIHWNEYLRKQNNKKVKK